MAWDPRISGSTCVVSSYFFADRLHERPAADDLYVRESGSPVTRPLGRMEDLRESARFNVIARSLSHTYVYRLLVALIVLNLAQVTAGYACSMAGEVVQPMCCCDAAASRTCSEPNSNCSTSAMVASAGGGCCSIVLLSGIGAVEQTGAAAPNAPLLSRWAPEAIPVLWRADGVTPLDARSLTYATSRVYLLTGRLRR